MEESKDLLICMREMLAIIGDDGSKFNEEKVDKVRFYANQLIVSITKLQETTMDLPGRQLL